MHSPWTAGTGIDTNLDASIDIGVGDRTWVSCSVGLSYMLTADPFGLIHHCACMRQTTHIPHLHQQVSSCFEDVNCLIVGDSDKALTVHFQDLVTHLQQISIIKKKHYALHLPYVDQLWTDPDIRVGQERCILIWQAEAVLSTIHLFYIQRSYK